MAAKVKLQDIVDALDMQSDEILAFLNLDTGQVGNVSKELLREAERRRRARIRGILAVSRRDENDIKWE